MGTPMTGSADDQYSVKPEFNSDPSCYAYHPYAGMTGNAQAPAMPNTVIQLD